MFFTVALDVTTWHISPFTYFKSEDKEQYTYTILEFSKKRNGFGTTCRKSAIEKALWKKKKENKKKTILCSDTWNKMFYQRKMQIAISGNKM